MNSSSSNPHSYSSTNMLPPWGLAQVFSAFFLGFVVAPLGMSVLLRSAGPSLLPLAKLFIIHLASYVIWLVILVSLSKRYGAEAYRYLGLKIEKKPWDYLLDGFFCAGCILLVGWFLGFLAEYYGWPHDQPYDNFPENHLKLIAVLAIMVAPLIEEIAFRGFLQIALYRYMPAQIAIIVTAVVFTLFHSLYFGQWIAMFYVLLMGLILGVFRHVSRSAIPGMIGHFINNVMAAVVLLG